MEGQRSAMRQQQRRITTSACGVGGSLVLLVGPLCLFEGLQPPAPAVAAEARRSYGACVQANYSHPQHFGSKGDVDVPPGTRVSPGGEGGGCLLSSAFPLIERKRQPCLWPSRTPTPGSARAVRDFRPRPPTPFSTNSLQPPAPAVAFEARRSSGLAYKPITATQRPIGECAGWRWQTCRGTGRRGRRRNGG